MTWLFMPSSCLLASACSERDCEPGSDAWASRIAPSATLSGKLTQPQSWRRASKKAAWMLLLSGPTLPPSTLDAGLESWIASLRDSRAKTCQSLAGGPALTGPDQGFSSRSCASPAIAVRNGSFWRTSQASLLPPPPLWTKPKGLLKSAPPPESWENWPISGGTRNGSLFQRPAWAPATAVTDGFVSPKWQTPTAGEESGDGLNGRGEPKLKAQAMRWATPDCNTSSYSNGVRGPNIREQAALWKTVTTSEHTGAGAGPKKSGGENLRSQIAAWPTPASRDFRSPNSQTLSARGGGAKGEQLPNYVEHHFSHPAQQTQHGPKSSGADPILPRRLNPAFVEWLMGWPIGWTIAEPSASSAAETALWRRRKLLRHLSHFIGD